MIKKEKPIILAIESSCDDTSAAVIKGKEILSNVVYSQKIHQQFGGVVPELASRSHDQKITLTVEKAINDAQITKSELDAIAFTRGPGLIGSLLVGVCFSKSMAMALNIPLIEVNHMQAHALSPLIEHQVVFPALCMVVSGGHTQLVWMKSELELEIIGQTIDDAAGEAFDKAAKMLQLPYPGGPLIDKNAKEGNPKAYEFSKPNLAEYNYSFSGLKTSILYFLNKQKAQNENFVEENLQDLCASIQYTIIEILLSKAKKAIKELRPKTICLAGGVSANSGLRAAVVNLAAEYNIICAIPSFQFCTDNAGMIAYVSSFLYDKEKWSGLDVEPLVKNYSI